MSNILNKIPIIILINDTNQIIIDKINDKNNILYIYQFNNNLKNLNAFLKTKSLIHNHIYILNLIICDNIIENTAHINIENNNSIFYNYFVKYFNLKLIYNGYDGIIKQDTINTELDILINSFGFTYIEIILSNTLFGIKHHPENINSYKKNRFLETLNDTIVNYINIYKCIYNI